MGRAIVINVMQLSTYSYLKIIFSEKLFHMKEGMKLHFACSGVSALCTTITSMPLDIAKTRIQNQKDNRYKGTIHVLSHILRNEGFLAMWKGFTPYFLRLGPHTVFTLMFLEQFKKLYLYFSTPTEPPPSSLSN